MMKNIRACKAFIEKHEGRKNKMYLDTHGHPTIGVGFNLDKKNSKMILQSLGLKLDQVKTGKTTLTEVQINKLFEHDLAIAIEDAKKFYRAFDFLDEVRQLVLVDMAFNLGYTMLSQFIKFHQALESKNYEKAAAEMLFSKWAEQVKHRATENASAMRIGKIALNMN